MPMRIPGLWIESLRASGDTAASPPVVDIRKHTASELTPRPMHHSYSEVSLPFNN
jgi:hypothetical protein